MSYPKGRSFGEHSPRSREKKLKTITDKVIVSTFGPMAEKRIFAYFCYAEQK